MRGLLRIGRTLSQSTAIASPGRAGPRCVARAIAPADHELLETEVVSDLFAFGMEHIAIAIPDLESGATFSLIDYLIQRSQCGTEVVDRDDATAATRVERVC